MFTSASCFPCIVIIFHFFTLVSVSTSLLMVAAGIIRLSKTFIYIFSIKASSSGISMSSVKVFGISLSRSSSVEALLVVAAAFSLFSASLPSSVPRLLATNPTAVFLLERAAASRFAWSIRLLSASSCCRCNSFSALCFEATLLASSSSAFFFADILFFSSSSSSCCCFCCCNSCSRRCSSTFLVASSSSAFFFREIRGSTTPAGKSQRVSSVSWLK